ncbi:MAG: hypothetical protein IID32_04560 [Planctomycetes bacterium]|nr:hypothetical protein [Planctomycetota bacterium]
MHTQQIQKIKQDGLDFCRSCRWVVLFFLFALMCDAASTSHFMVRFGTEGEIHPVYRLAGEAFGPHVGPFMGFIGKAMGGMLVASYLRKWAAYILLAAGAISLWAAWYNVWGYQLYMPNILNFIWW